MANRHLSRSVVLQTLFEWDFRNYSAQKAVESLLMNAAELSPLSAARRASGEAGLASGKDQTSDEPFMEELLRGVIARVKDLDMVIEKAAPEWPIERIAPVDRNVLRLGLYELLFADRDKVPAKVAINEAIELAKSFGGEHSGRFVNGVLGAVYKELGEPGKDEVSKKKKEVPYEEMPQERLVGAVVYAKSGGEVYLALVHDIFGHWTLSKGKLLPDEEAEVGVVRKVKEEIGLDVTPISRLGENEYVASDPKEGKKRKHVIFFLAESPFKEVELAKKGGLDDARWFRVQDALELNFYEDMLPIVTKGLQQLSDSSKKKTTTR